MNPENTRAWPEFVGTLDDLMPLMRLREVREHYEADALDSPEDCQLMLVLLPLLSEVCKPYPPVWPLPSLTGLVLLARDDWESPWFVRIDPNTYSAQSYRVIARAPADASSQQDTLVIATTAEEAARAVDAGIRYSKGWQ